MNTRKNLALIAVGLVVLSVAFWLWNSSAPNAPTEKAQREAVSSATVSSLPQATTTPAAAASIATPPVTRSEQINRAVEKANVPIKFWGKVADPDGKPIAGVTIEYGVQQAYAPWFGAIADAERKNTIQTGPEGLFSITGEKGMTLNIHNLGKSGYTLSTKSETTFAYMGSPYLFTPHEHEPVVFILFRQEVQEPLIHYHTDIYVPCDGTPITYNLFDRKVRPREQLKIIFLCDPVHVLPGQRFSWRATLEVADGGIMEMPTTPAFVAPEAGWLESAAVEQKATDSQWRSGFIRSFYVRTSDGKYGRINVHVTGDFQLSTAAFSVEVFMNSSGSRNLEPGGTKQATNP